LRLLARKGVKAKEGFAARRAQFGHDTAELADTAGVTARANHLIETGGAQARILLQGLAQEVEVGIGELLAAAGMAAEAVGVQGGAYGVRMQAEFGRQGADLPMLGMEEMADVGDLFIGNHASPREKD
jgi:DNA-binding XRE family transcriptional regulator